MKRIISALSAGLLVGGLLLVVEHGQPAEANGGCDLSGSGTAQDPWRVVTKEHFTLVGVDDCGLNGHYLQGGDFSIDTLADHRITGNFSGVYDGDHYTITLVSANEVPRSPLFETISGGVKKLRLTGTLSAYGAPGDDVGWLRMGSLAVWLNGGYVSEVGSDVRLEGSPDPSQFVLPYIGGLVGNASGGALIQYSYFEGAIVWDIPSGGNWLVAGGLVGLPAGTWIRDSYSNGSISYDAPTGSTVRIGGLLGDASAGQQTIIRAYSTTSIDNTCTDVCLGVGDARIGGLIGNLQPGSPGATAQLVSTFWSDIRAENAFGGPPDVTQPLKYDAEGRPVAVPLSDATLRLIDTYRTKESSSSPSQPGGNPLTSNPGTRTPGTLHESDFRWAIEGDTSGFVASKRPGTLAPVSGTVSGETIDFSTTFNRQRWHQGDNPTVPASYSTRQLGAGQSPNSVSNYPVLGRIWEMCIGSTEDYPLPRLVWQAEECDSQGNSGNSSGNTGNGPGSPSLDTSASHPGILAATGTSENTLQLGMVIALMLGLVGVWLIGFARRQTGRT